MDEQVDSGQWAILELMGRKVVAGYLTQDDWQGHAMVRIDVPATSAFPAFTQVYGPQAVYCITYTSEEVARLTAEHNRVNPVSVYVPDLQDVRRVAKENDELRNALHEMRERLAKTKGLPAPQRQAGSEHESGPSDPDTDPTRLQDEWDEPLFEQDEEDDEF